MGAVGVDALGAVGLDALGAVGVDVVGALEAGVGALELLVLGAAARPSGLATLCGGVDPVAALVLEPSVLDAGATGVAPAPPAGATPVLPGASVGCRTSTGAFEPLNGSDPLSPSPG